MSWELFWYLNNVPTALGSSCTNSTNGWVIFQENLLQVQNVPNIYLKRVYISSSFWSLCKISDFRVESEKSLHCFDYMHQWTSNALQASKTGDSLPKGVPTEESTWSIMRKNPDFVSQKTSSTSWIKLKFDHVKLHIASRQNQMTFLQHICIAPRCPEWWGSTWSATGGFTLLLRYRFEK